MVGFVSKRSNLEDIHGLFFSCRITLLLIVKQRGGAKIDLSLPHPWGSRTKCGVSYLWSIHRSFTIHLRVS